MKDASQSASVSSQMFLANVKIRKKVQNSKNVLKKDATFELMITVSENTCRLL